MAYFDPARITFAHSGTGFLNVTDENGTLHEHVACVSLYPLSLPGQFISVVKKKGNNTEEIGIIRKLHDLPAEQRKLVKTDMELRYFTPEITDIVCITSRYGMDQWDVTTDRGDKTFFVRNIKENVYYRDDGLIVITDIDKNRYQITDHKKLPKKSQQYLELTLL